MTQTEKKNELPFVPPFLSIRFHLQYFPALIWRRIRPRAEEPRPSFANHGSAEYFLIMAVCVIAFVVGLPAALHGSVVGVMAAGLGFIGIAAILIFSVVSVRGTYAGFEDFRIWVFFFFVMLGVTVGIFSGSLDHSTSKSLLYAAGGLAVGYPIGIGAGCGCSAWDGLRAFLIICRCSLCSVW